MDELKNMENNGRKYICVTTKMLALAIETYFSRNLVIMIIMPLPTGQPIEAYTLSHL